MGYLYTVSQCGREYIYLFYHTALYFFILLDYEAIAKGWIKLVPVKHRDTTIKIVNDVQEGMNKYFRGQAVVAFV